MQFLNHGKITFLLLKRPFVPDNVKKYKIKHAPIIKILLDVKHNILLILGTSYKTEKELFEISSIFR